MEKQDGNALTDDLYDLFYRTGFSTNTASTRTLKNAASAGCFASASGCPAVAAGYHGDMYAPDPQCWKGGKTVNVSKRFACAALSADTGTNRFHLRI